jgi:hypothetical protein
MTDHKSQVQRLVVHNKHPHSVELWLEPWGDRLLMPEDARYEVIVKGPDANCIEVVQFSENRIFIWGGSGSTLSVFSGGAQLRECSVPVPGTRRS